jgi:hypothetical protein
MQPGSSHGRVWACLDGSSFDWPLGGVSARRRYAGRIKFIHYRNVLFGMDLPQHAAAAAAGNV